MKSNTYFVECSSEKELESIGKLILKYRSACNICWKEELGHDCPLSDGEIVRECLLDGLRVTRRAISIVRQQKGSKR
jgi:hypothetical protein